MGRLGLILVAAGLLTIGGGAAAVYAQSTTTVVMAEFSFTPSSMVVPPDVTHSRCKTVADSRTTCTSRATGCPST